MFHSLCALENSEKFLQSVSLNNPNVFLLRQQMFSTVIECEINHTVFKNSADVSEIDLTDVIRVKLNDVGKSLFFLLLTLKRFQMFKILGYFLKKFSNKYHILQISIRI